MREALAMSSQVPIVFGPQFVASSLPDIQEFRTLARALAAEAKLAESDKRNEARESDNGKA